MPISLPHGATAISISRRVVYHHHSTDIQALVLRLEKFVRLALTVVIVKVRLVLEDSLRDERVPLTPGIVIGASGLE